MNGEALRDELARAYGTPLPGVPLRWHELLDESAVSLADRVAPMLDDAPPPPPPPSPPPDPAPWPRLPVATRDDAAALHAVTAWATAQGAVLDGVEIRIAADGNRSVHAREALVRNQRVMVVPRALMLVDDDLAATPLGLRLAPARERLASPHTPFATWLAIERGLADSPWRPYLDVLPAAPDVPTFRPDAELAGLADTAARAGIMAARRILHAEHAVVREVVGADDPGLAEHAWAHALTNSRMFKLRIEGTDRRAMVPVADFFDHGPGDTTWAYDDAAGGLVITAARRVAAGEELRLGYGQFSNAHLLAHYGFAVDDNRDDVALLLFPPAPTPLVDVAAACLWDHRLRAPVELEVGARVEAGFRRALSLARLRAASYRDLLHATDRGRFDNRELLWLGPAVETAALALVADAARAGLARLAPGPTGDEPDPWARTQARVRAGERAVLEAILELPARAAPYLADPSPHAWYRAAVSIDILASGGLGLVRHYILNIADELPR